MAERDRIERLEYQLATVARQIAGMPVRIARSGAADKFRLIRGQSYGVQSGTNILLDNIVELSGGLDPSGGNPATTVSVYNLFGATFADNEWVDAVYSPGATGSSDWETLKGSAGSGAAPLRWFELTFDKATSDAYGVGKFLDDAGNLVGTEDELFFDTLGKFYGKAGGFYGVGTRGFRGIALLRTDLGTIEADRWEIVALEGWADWVVLTYAGSPDNEWQLTSFGNTDAWNYKRPAADGAALTVADPLSELGSPQDGDKIIAVLTNPDTSPPTYQVREVKRAGLTTATIKVPTSIELNLTASELRVKLHYAEYSITAVDLSSTGTLEDAVDVTECSG